MSVQFQISIAIYPLLPNKLKLYFSNNAEFLLDIVNPYLGLLLDYPNVYTLIEHLNFHSKLSAQI